MQELSAEVLFDLEHFAHKELFAETEFAWEALKRLEDYFQSQALGKIEIAVPISAYLVQPEQISIGKGTIIEPGAYIQGPCIIGEGCHIRHGAYIRGYVVTGDRCVIGHATEIKHSILLNDARAAHFNYVGDSILGNEVNLGAGVKCANLRLDQKPVLVDFQGKKIATGMHKLGLIAGDGSQIGCNATSNPGTVLSRKALCRPCLAISGYAARRQIAKVLTS